MPEEILCITHKYPPFIGGMENQSYELIKGLSGYYQTHIIAYQGKMNKFLWFLKLRWKVKSYLKQHPSIKLIHLNDGTMGVAMLWLQKKTRIPIVVTYHGLDITFPSAFFQNKLVPRLKKYDGAICVSEFTRQQCLKKGFNQKTTFTVNNGVNTSLGDIPFDETIVQKLQNIYGIDIAGKNVLVSTGRPVKRKGFSWFLKNVMPLLDDNTIFLMMGPLKKKQTQFEKFVQKLPRNIGYKIHLLFGFPTDKPEIIKQLAKQKNAYHLGKVSDEDLYQILSIADLFVMPNLSFPGDVEGFGLVALEASMRGTYVLASNIDGIPSAVIHNQNGILLPSGDAQAWANKIHELLSDKNRLKILSEKGKEYTQQHFSWKMMADGYINVFDRFISLSSTK
jgi:phosphatidylinositol alpha-1,6-mannosyltransferase